MSAARRPGQRRPLRQQLCAVVSLIAFLIAALGFPIPVPAKKCGDGVFACQGLGCGCETAEQCATCGCFGAGETCSRSVAPPFPAETSCCCGNPKGSCCCSGPATTHDCCQSSPPVTVRWVAGLSALKCKGVATLWATSGAVIPPPPDITFAPCLPAGEWLPLAGDAPVTIAVRPPVPPPRCSAQFS